MRLHLAYGRQGLPIDLPDELPTTVIEPRHVPGLADERAAIAAALRDPIGSPPLRERVSPQDRVAILFSDLTRPMPNDRVLPVLLEELRSAGVPVEQVLLINALGTHRPQTEAELRGMLGDKIVDRYHIVQHDAWDDANLVPVARNRAGRMVRIHRAYAEAEVRILTGFIEPHFFAGYSGGPKAVLPGIADVESVMDNHNASMLADPRATWAVTRGNPLWEEMLEVAVASAPTFLLNVTLNREHEITGVFAGDLAEAHAAGAEFVARTAIQPVPEPFDIVITSNSGYPLDLNLYQAIKGASAASAIVREGGHIIVAAECWDGVPSHGEYQRLLRSAASPEDLLSKVMAPGFRCHDQWQVQIQCQIQRKAQLHVYSDGLSDEELRRALVIPCRSIEGTVAELVEAARGSAGENRPAVRVAVLPQGPQTIPCLAPVGANPA